MRAELLEARYAANRREVAAEHAHTPGVQDCIDWLQSWDEGSDPVWFRATQSHLRTVSTLAAEVEALKAKLSKLEHHPDTAAADTLVNRLRGIYTIPITDGLGPLDGKDDFTSLFPSPPIQKVAADRIEALESENAALKGERGELVAGFSQALHLLRNVEVFVMTREKINHPTGSAWFVEECSKFRALLSRLTGGAA